MKYVIILCLLFQALSISAFGQAYKYHTVAGDETVSAITSKYNISNEILYKYNPDAKNGLQPGMKLVIALKEENSTGANEASATGFRSHKVERKQTLYSLSKLYDVSIDDIKRYNKQLYSKELQYGETIKIPVFTQEKVQREKPARQSGKVQITSTREHVVIPKETKYGIARKYGMTVKELEALNPTVDELHPGVMLKVSTDVLENEPVIITDENFDFYEVKPKETLYSLTRRFQVEQDSLIALNPALKEGLKSGMVLKVPTRDAEGKELEDIDIEEEFEGGVVEELDLEDHIKDFSTKDLVVMLPFNLRKIRKDSVSNATSVLQNDRVMRISVDFYSGVLMAVENAKNLGLSTNLRVFDTERNQEKVSEIIRSNNFDGVDAVIGPLLQATSEEAASRLRNSNVPVISPISNRELRSLPNLYQAGPSDEMLREAMIKYLQKYSNDKNIIIIADAASVGIKNRLLAALPSARTVNPSGNNISESTIANAIVKGKENWIILESESVSLLSSATSDLNRMARNNDIVLFTTNKNQSFESDVLSNDHLGRLKFHFPSEYKEYDETVRSSFVDNYIDQYGVIPNKYTIRGYDLTMDILLRLGAMESLENSVSENMLTEYVENKFLYKPRPNGGFYNDAIYIMHLNEDLTLSVAKK